MLITVIGYQTSGFNARFGRQMKTVYGIKEKERPNSFVKILALMAKLLQFTARAQKFPKRSPLTYWTYGLVPNTRVIGRNNLDE
jgi:hypothetical protein